MARMKRKVIARKPRQPVAPRARKDGSYVCPKCGPMTIAPDKNKMHKCARCRSEYLPGKTPPTGMIPRS